MRWTQTHLASSQVLWEDRRGRTQDRSPALPDVPSAAVAHWLQDPTRSASQTQTQREQPAISHTWARGGGAREGG